jgi:hypothetical protein
MMLLIKTITSVLKSWHILSIVLHHVLSISFQIYFIHIFMSPPLSGRDI